MNNTSELILRPAGIYALLRVFPLLGLSLAFLLLSSKVSTLFLFPSLASTGVAWYRYLFTRNYRYCLSPEIIRLQQGIVFKRVDQVELFRMKDYIVLQPLLLQVFGLMHLILKSTDPVNPVIKLQGIPASNLADTIRQYVQEARKHNQIVEIN